MAELHVILDTPDGDRVNVKTQVDNPTQARTLALAKHPGATINGIMNLSSGDWVTPDPGKDEPLPDDQIPDKDKPQTDDTATSVTVDSVKGREQALMSFATSVTVAAVIAGVFLTTAMLSVDMDGRGDFASMFGAMEVTAFEAQSQLLGMTLAYPLIGLYLIAVLLGWFAHFRVMPAGFATSLATTSFIAALFFLGEAALQPILQTGDVSILTTGFWVQTAFCVVFGAWAFTLENANSNDM